MHKTKKPHHRSFSFLITVCNNYQFACTDGSDCIAIYDTCNGINQCQDGSDESPELCPQGNTTKVQTARTAEYHLLFCSGRHKHPITTEPGPSGSPGRCRPVAGDKAPGSGQLGQGGREIQPIQEGQSAEAASTAAAAAATDFISAPRRHWSSSGTNGRTNATTDLGVTALLQH